MDNVVSGIVGVIVVIAVVAALGFGIWLKRLQGGANDAEGVIATLQIPDGAMLRLTQTELIEGFSGERHRLSGLVARVEEGGTVNRRFTVTRIMALGVLAAGVPKKIDDRTIYLTIEGPTTIIVHAIPVKKDPQIVVTARTFAAKINNLSKATSMPAPVATSGSAARPATDSAPAALPSREGSPNRIEGLMAKLRELEQLRASGLISDDEYAAKRVSMLEQF